jgi:kinesin family protein C1
VRVGVRLKPMSATEGARVIESNDDGSVVAKGQDFGPFDSVFGEEIVTPEIYQKMVSPLVGDVLDGINCAVLAYGQTGSGKTFTMGTSKGIIARSIRDVPRGIKRDEITKNSSSARLTLEMSHNEIYKENIFDLFSEIRKKVEIREDPTTGTAFLEVRETL